MRHRTDVVSVKGLAAIHLSTCANLLRAVRDQIAVEQRDRYLAAEGRSGRSMRIGHGYDVHAFEAGDSIILGGVRIPHDRAFKAHSDGDVLLHALTDALLGAVGKGDIGQHFPDTDPAYKGADSRELLRTAYDLVLASQCRCVSADMTIVAQRPKLSSWLPDMVKNIAEDLQMPGQRLNVKATTSERLGFCGREEGIAAHAVVLLEES